MPRSMRFAKHLLIAAVGATLDYLVGRLTNRLSWGIATWAAIVLVASALIDYLNEAPNSRPDWGEGGSLLSAVRTYMGPYRRPTIFRAAMAGLCAAVASCALTLAVITFRFCADHGTAWLGKGSPFDESVAVFVGNFQASSPTVWLMATCIVLALFIPWRLVVLPAGVATVAIANAMLVGIPPLSRGNPGWYSQFAYALGSVDGLLFRLPVVVTPYTFLVPALLGMGACGVITLLLD